VEKFLYKLFFFLSRKKAKVFWLFRYILYSIRGAKIHKSVSFSKLVFSWPHKVRVGKGCNLESGVCFKYDGIYTKGIAISIGNDVFIGTNVEFNIKYDVTIGDGCLIGAGSRFVDHDHGIALGLPIRVQPCPGLGIILEDDVWIGANVVILKGVTIQKGAIVAAGAVVTKSILCNEIWGGVPAKKIGERK
jgi:acetyltransferase-like isoleucine patch superfamily enzyme